jgi:putative membrane protein
MGLKYKCATAVIVCGIIGAGAALSQDFGMSASPDGAFATKAASGGMAEVKLGRLAQDKGTSNAVTDFGKQMEVDHSKANDQLKNVASRNNVALPIDLSAEDRAEYDRLSGMSGSDFDKAYAEAMVKDHQKDIADFKKEATEGKNPDIKTFATQTLPTLQGHLKGAQAMEQSVVAGNAGH